VGGLAVGVVLKLLFKAVLMPLLGADSRNQAYQFLIGNPAALLAMLVEVLFGAAFGEEVFFRGYLFERLGRLLGGGARAKTAIVLSTALLFGALHAFDQGLAGAQQATLIGLVFGGLYLATGRLWASMAAHAGFDLTALAILYWDLEEQVAGWFFG